MVAVVTFGVLAGLTGCGAAGDLGNGGLKSDQEQALSTPPGTAEPIAGDENGDGRLSEFEKQILAQNAPVDYVMPDGSIVTIQSTGDVPVEVNRVLVDLAQPLGDKAKEHTTSSDVAEAVGRDMRAMASSLSDSIGRPVVVVYGKSDGRRNTYWGTSSSLGGATGIMAELDRDAVIVSTRAWAEPRGYEVVVLS